MENASFGWQSPALWTSIINDTRDNPDPNAPQSRYPMIYQRYTNEFVGNVFPVNSLSMRKLEPLSPLLAYTVAANGPLSGSEYEEVCTNELTSTTITFPTDRRYNNGVEASKDEVIINHFAENNTINIQLPNGKDTYSLRVTDLLGRTLVKEQGKGNQTFTTPSLKKGIHFVTFESNGKQLTKKIMVR